MMKRNTIRLLLLLLQLLMALVLCSSSISSATIRQQCTRSATTPNSGISTRITKRREKKITASTKLSAVTTTRMMGVSGQSFRSVRIARRSRRGEGREMTVSPTDDVDTTSIPMHNLDNQCPTTAAKTTKIRSQTKQQREWTSSGSSITTTTTGSGRRSFVSAGRSSPFCCCWVTPVHFARSSNHHIDNDSHRQPRCPPTSRATPKISMSNLFSKGIQSLNKDDNDEESINNNMGGDVFHNESEDNTNGVVIQQHQWKKQQQLLLTKEFFAIGCPAFIQLAAEPLASLVDAAYLGRLGPEVLGGAGVAISAQYAVSKLYNDPLLRTSISLVAAQDGKARSTTSASSGSIISNQESTQLQQEQQKKDLSVAVSSALLLAGTVGFIQMLVYGIFAKAITRTMGLSSLSPMWYSAISYLQIRALGTPATTLWLVTNGIFRGLGNTRTPLIYSLVFTGLNIIFDPIFIFTLQYGASGAAAGTALAQYIALIPLLYALHQRVSIDIMGQLSELRYALQQYVQAGTLVLIRTIAKVLAYSICARQAALLGSVGAAAYNLTFQLGFATTQICEAVAVAVQTLLAREMAMSDAITTPVADDDTEQNNNNNQEINDSDRMIAFQSKESSSSWSKGYRVRHLITTGIWSGAGVATILSLSTYWRRHWILAGLTTNPQVQASALSIFPIVLLTQTFKGLAYPVNGIIMGGLDWFYSMIVMWISNLVCLGCIAFFGSSTLPLLSGGAVVGTTSGITLAQIWWSLAAFMGTQVIAGILRYESKRGIWKVLDYKQSKITAM